MGATKIIMVEAQVFTLKNASRSNKGLEPIVM
jgi:hypothetical protein